MNISNISQIIDDVILSEAKDLAFAENRKVLHCACSKPVLSEAEGFRMTTLVFA